MSLRNVIAFGGPDTTLLGWFAHIDRERFRVSLTSFVNPGDPDAYFLQKLHEGGIETFHLPWGRSKTIVKAVRELMRLMREQRVDVLHTHDIRADVVGYLAARLAGIPIMTTIYVWFQATSLTKVRYLEKLDRLFLRHFDGLTSISEATRQQTIGYGFPAASIETIYSGIDVDKFDIEFDAAAVRASLGVTAEDRLFVYLARLYPEKAHRNFVAALPAVVARDPRVRAVFVGEGPCRADLERQARELGVAEHVIFTGIRRDVPHILKTCEVMVHPSLAEGIPLGVQEGMAAGLPVIGTDVDGTPEVVLHERTGLLIPPNDIPALSAAMCRLVDDPALGRMLGTAGRAMINDQLSAARVVRQLEDVYRRVHADYRGRGKRNG